MDFNYETLKGLIDRAIVALVAWAVGAGYIPADLVGAITPVLMGIPPLIFAWWFNRQVSLVQAAASMPDVTKVVVSSQLDASKLSAPDAKVTQS